MDGAARRKLSDPYRADHGIARLQAQPPASAATWDGSRRSRRSRRAAPARVRSSYTVRPLPAFSVMAPTGSAMPRTMATASAIASTRLCQRQPIDEGGGRAACFHYGHVLGGRENPCHWRGSSARSFPAQNSSARRRRASTRAAARAPLTSSVISAGRSAGVDGFQGGHGAGLGSKASNARKSRPWRGAAPAWRRP